MDLTKQEVLRDAKGDRSKLKLASRKLDVLGCVKSFSMITSDSECLDRSQNQLQLSQSLVAIEQAAKEDEKKKKDGESKDCCELGPKAMQKLTKKSMDISKLAKKETSAVFLFYFSVDIHPNSRTKRSLAKSCKLEY